VSAQAAPLPVSGFSRLFAGWTCSPVGQTRCLPRTRSEPGAGETEGNGEPSPAERHREFSEENGRWNSRMDEAFSELDELADESESDSSKKATPP